MDFKHTRRRWTERDDAELWSLYGNEPVSIIAGDLKRSENSIRKRASILGLSSKSRRRSKPRREWTDDEEWTLVEKFNTTNTRELAEELNRSETAIINRARLIGVKSRYKTKD